MTAGNFRYVLSAFPNFRLLHIVWLYGVFKESGSVDSTFGSFCTLGIRTSQDLLQAVKLA